MYSLITLLNKLETTTENFEKENHRVSKANIGWHVEHALLTLNGVIDAVTHSTPAKYKWTFNLSKILILALKKIPRGRAKAPERVVPKGNIDINSLKKHIDKTRDKLQELQSMDNNKYFNHPFWGHLTLKQTVTFLQIHTNHHLKIINGILK